MKKITILILLLGNALFPQKLIGSLTFKQKDFSKEIVFGLDSTATDYIDRHLEEIEAPPFPPSDAKEVRFVGETIGLGLYKDFRNINSNAVISHKIKAKLNSYDSIFLVYKIPEQVKAILKDPVNGLYVKYAISGEGVLFLTNDINLFSELILEVNYSNISLPVNLIDFKCSFVENKVVLKWKTASEINNYGFEIHKAKIEDNSEFNVIGFVEAKLTTANFNEYSFEDKDIVSGNYIYRLKQIDYDGNFVFYYSEPINVKKTDNTEIKVFPNPFNIETNLEIVVNTKTKLKVSLYDLNGKEAKSFYFEVDKIGKNRFKLRLDDLTSGFYFVRAIYDNISLSYKICLLK